MTIPKAVLKQKFKFLQAACPFKLLKDILLTESVTHNEGNTNWTDRRCWLPYPGYLFQTEITTNL